MGSMAINGRPITSLEIPSADIESKKLQGAKGFAGVPSSITSEQFGGPNKKIDLATVNAFQRAVNGSTYTKDQAKDIFQMLDPAICNMIKNAIWEVNGKNDNNQGMYFGDSVIDNLDQQTNMDLLRNAVAKVITDNQPLTGKALFIDLVGSFQLLNLVLQRPNATVEQIKALINELPEADKNMLKGAIYAANGKKDEGKSVGFGDYVIENLQEKRNLDLLKVANANIIAGATKTTDTPKSDSVKPAAKTNNTKRSKGNFFSNICKKICNTFSNLIAWIKGLFGFGSEKKTA